MSSSDIHHLSLLTASKRGILNTLQSTTTLALGCFSCLFYIHQNEVLRYRRPDLRHDGNCGASG